MIFGSKNQLLLGTVLGISKFQAGLKVLWYNMLGYGPRKP